ncbi:MAG: GNAT family N-acetyltransferase [Thermoanaerobaculia bacterium]
MKASDARTQITLAVSAEEIAIVRELFHEYHAQIGIDLCFQGFAHEVEGLPGEYAPPFGRLFLAAHDGAPVGCIALRAVDATRCEMKRLFLRPEARGLGLGRALVDLLLEEARAIGYEEIVLDTLPTLVEAQRIYEQLGFRDIPPYRENPVSGARYLGKLLNH